MDKSNWNESAIESAFTAWVDGTGLGYHKLKTAFLAGFAFYIKDEEQALEAFSKWVDGTAMTEWTNKNAFFGGSFMAFEISHS